MIGGTGDDTYTVNAAAATSFGKIHDFAELGVLGVNKDGHFGFGQNTKAIVRTEINDQGAVSSGTTPGTSFLTFPCGRRLPFSTDRFYFTGSSLHVINRERIKGRLSQNGGEDTCIEHACLGQSSGEGGQLAKFVTD
jgi:hypothetical protein